MIPNPSIQWICWVHGKEKAKEVVGPPSGRGVLRECFPGRFLYHLTCSKFWVLDICDSSKKIGLFHKTQAIIYLDVVKSRVQADDPSKPLYKGSLDCVRQSYKRYQFIITDNLSASIALNAAIRNLRLLESISWKESCEITMQDEHQNTKTHSQDLTVMSGSENCNGTEEALNYHITWQFVLTIWSTNKHCIDPNKTCFQGRPLGVLPRVHLDVKQSFHCQWSHICCSGATQQDVQSWTIMIDS